MWLWLDILYFWLFQFSSGGPSSKHFGEVAREGADGRGVPAGWVPPKMDRMMFTGQYVGIWVVLQDKLSFIFHKTDPTVRRPDTGIPSDPALRKYAGQTVLQYLLCRSSVHFVLVVF